MIPHNRPCLAREEIDAAADVISSGQLAQAGQVAALEDEMCDFLGLPNGCGVAVSSGSAALYLALAALGAAGRSVAAPAYSCRALHNAVAFAGARAHWLDVAAGSPVPDYDDDAVQDADLVIVAHMFGIPARLPSRPGAVVVEDLCQALGASIVGKKVGTLGAAGVLSFAATKLMTTGGQGGMVVSRDSGVVASVRAARNYDTVLDGCARFNFQMTDLQAAIGRTQLRKLPALLERREMIFRRYVEAGGAFLDPNLPDIGPVRFRAVLRTDDPDGLMRRFADQGVTTIVPITEVELMAPPAEVPNASHLSRTSLSLPIFPGLEDRQVDRVVQALADLNGGSSGSPR